jgi:dCTP deaminase
MSDLCAQDIRDRCVYFDHAEYKVVSFGKPLIYPFAERTVDESGLTYGLGPASYDVRLAKGVLVWPLWGRLAVTYERVNIPITLKARVCDKSTNARRFITVQNTLIDPGFEGHITLELTRHRPWPVYLPAGYPIAQLEFTMLTRPTDQPYSGKYQDQPMKAVDARYERGKQ